jgi:4-hydroxybenzoate polyprenyltransferase
MTSTQTALGARADFGARLGGWLTLARVSNTPTIVSNVLVGAALGGAREPSMELGLLVVAMVGFYTAGMLLNDVCDYRWDLAHRPDRPLVTGLVSRRAALGGTLALFALGVVLLWPLGARALLAGLVLIGCIVAYDVWHKTNPLSPLVMAVCRLLVYVTACLAFAWPPPVVLAIAGGLLVLHLVGLTAIAKSEARPSMTGYWPAALLLIAPLYFLLQAPGFLAPAPGLPAEAPGLPAQAAGLPAQVPVLAVADAVWLLVSMRLIYRPAPRRIGAAVARLIAGISLLDLLILAALAAPPLFLALALLAFGLTLLLQRFVEGT